MWTRGENGKLKKAIKKEINNDAQIFSLDDNLGDSGEWSSVPEVLLID